MAVIAAKPPSPVTVLTKGKLPVTAFIPNDWSFRQLAKELTGVALPAGDYDLKVVAAGDGADGKAIMEADGVGVYHGHVLVFLARDPDARMRDVAEAVGITGRAVQQIVRDMAGRCDGQVRNVAGSDAAAKAPTSRSPRHGEPEL